MITFFTFVLEQNATDMLHSITWGQFGTALLPLAIIYYVYVLLKFYKHELVVFFSGNTDRLRGQAAVTDGAA